jgi:Domain of Unknown Function (DUF1080)
MHFFSLRYPGSFLLVAGALIVSSFTNWLFYQPKGKSLFNGKDLRGWDTYVGPAYDTIQKKFIGKPVGLNNDTDRVFTVVKVDGKPALRISGEKFGGISTQQSFENYHLRLEFKWGKLKWHPKRYAKMDSGLLYHAVGTHGADGGFWMRSQEFQIQEGDCGDYWGVAGGIADVPAIQQSENRFVYTPDAPLLTFKEKGSNGRNCIKYPDAERPTGEWNSIDLYCVGDTSMHVVNGKVTMVLYNLRQVENEKETPLTKGKIQLQSEGAELFYRNIQLEEISALPKNLLD